ncbi:MAG: transposase [bacterium]
MARSLRIEYPGALYHIVARGNAKGDIFISDNDREYFIKQISLAVNEYKIDCFAYCLMNNHYHLLIQTRSPNLSSSLRRLNSVYAQYFNRVHKRVGHLFQGRFKAILVQKESYLLELCRYIVLNPVRARLVDDPAKWPWSSYAATAGLIKCPEWLSASFVREQFAKRPEKAMELYKEFLTSGVNSESPWGKMEHPGILGDEDFVAENTAYFDLMDLSGEYSTSEKETARPTLDTIFLERKDDIAKRNQGIRTAHFMYCYSQAEIAKYIKMHYSGVSKIIKEHRLKLR